MAATNPNRRLLEEMFEGTRPLFALGQRAGLRFTGFKEGMAELELEVRPEHHNPFHVVHGGVIFGLLDTAMGFAATSVLVDDEVAQTVDVKINFVKALTQGRLRATSKVLRRGRTVCHLEASALDDQDELVAQALGIALFMRASERRQKAT